MATQTVAFNQQNSTLTTANATPQAEEAQAAKAQAAEAQAEEAQAEEAQAEEAQAEEAQAEEAQARVAPMRLRLKNNGFGVGKIVPSRAPSVIGWQNAGFVEPFFVDVSAVRSISTIQAADQVADQDADQDAEKQQSHFLIESTDGQSITGQITGLDSDWLTIQSTILGEVQLPINKVGQLIRADYTGEIIYSGLSQQAAWSPIGQPGDWDIRAGVLTALKQGAAILGDVKLPAKCEIVIAIAWRGVPDFVVSLGAEAGERNAGQVVSTARLEVWNRNIVLVRETDKDADLTRLAELNEKNPQVELSILMDQEAGVVVVQDVHGRLLGKLQVSEKKPRIGPAIHIVNHGPSLTVERLEVRSWNGSSTLGRDQNLQVVLRDQQTLNQSWLSRLTADGQFLIESKDGSSSNVPMDSVLVAGLRPRAEPLQDPAKEEENKNEPNEAAKPSGDQSANQPSAKQEPADKLLKHLIEEKANDLIEVIFSDRSRLKGQWKAAQSGKLVLHSSWCDRDLSFPVESAIGIIGTEERFAPDLTAHRNGIIKIDDSELPGFLVEDVANSGANAIRWQPHGSQSSSAVDPMAEGSIAYRLQLPISASGQPTGRLDELLSQQRTDSNTDSNTDQSTTAPVASTEKSQVNETAVATQVTREIVFASGDTIDGYVERADEKGVYFLSEQTQVRFVEHSKLDRLWLNSMASSVKKAANEKIQRLMTVPRAQKDDPPTHLLISVSGDFLRGRLVQLTDKSAQFDVRSTIAEIPREKIAQIIWLHQRNWNQSTAAEAPEADDYSIHVVQQERGLTFSPTHVTAAVIHGQSDLLGSCKIAVNQISQILFGPKLGERVTQFRENPWVLSLAQLPRAFLDDDSGSDSGVESPLIGKPAPPFTLSQLDGQQFRLSSLEGKVVVLDFWASWCGPCMKTLPVVHQVVSNFDPNEVQLVAVNIQEAEARVQAAMEKLAISGFVALDRDGEVAASYQATAIPQTVVIDKAGLVRFVFVGGSNELGANLKDAIDELLREAS